MPDRPVTDERGTHADDDERVSLYPLTFEEALAALLTVDPGSDVSDASDNGEEDEDDGDGS